MIQLSVKDRIYLPTILLKNYDLVDGQTKRHIEEKIEFSEQEIEALNFNRKSGSVTWDATASQDIEVEFTFAQMDFMKHSVKLLSQQHQINDEIFSLCERIDSV